MEIEVEEATSAVVAPPAAAAAAAAAPSTPPVIRKPFEIEVFKLIKEAQSAHGLRYDDYNRYKQYCSRRLKRIRKSLKFVSSVKGKYHKREISAKNIDDERYILIPLVQAERAWACAMQIREENSSNEARPKHHLIRRLKKAVVYSAKLKKYCEIDKKKVTTRTALEAEAYHYWMVGNISFELEDWAQALEKFVRISAVFEGLMGMENCSVNERQLFSDRIDDLAPFIRFCRRHVDKLPQEKQDPDLFDIKLAGSGAARDMLKFKLDSVLAENRKQTASTLSGIAWMGINITLKSEPLRNLVVAAQEHSHHLAQEKSLAEKMVWVDKILIAYNDALVILRAENVEGMTKAEATNARAYIQFLILRCTMNRNILLAEDYEQRLAANQPSLEGRSISALDLANLFDRLMGDMDDLSNLPVAKQNEDIQREAAARSLAFKSARVMWIAESFVANNQILEAIALFQRCISIAGAAIERLVQIADLRTDLEKCTSMQNRARGRVCSLHSDFALEEQKKKQGEEQVPAAATATKAEATKAPLISRLESYDAAISAGAHPKLVDFPPAMEAVPTKPVLFDLAFNSVQFPDLSARAKQKKGGVLGWLRR